ncbi:hypothetical protein ABIC66_004263 [Caulobacter sp. 1776]
MVHLVADVERDRLADMGQEVDLVDRKPLRNNDKRLTQTLNALKTFKVKLSRTERDRYGCLPIH